MDTQRQLQVVEEIAHEVDMLVFYLETDGEEEPAEQRERLRRELEGIRDRLRDLTTW